MINYVVSPSPTPLGDNIDSIFLGHMISKIENKKVNIISKSRDLNILSNLIGFGDVVINSEKFIPNQTIRYNIKDIKLYLKYSMKFKNIPLNKNIKSLDVNLPKKYVTAQWDAGQLYRKVDRWDPDRIKNIETYYKDQGYKIIHIGGQGRFKDLEKIIYVISKAKYHIGADSGMMHLAKFLLPIENIHVYINIRNRYNDVRFPDSWNVAFMAREIFRRGAKMNFCENPDSEKINYFKKVDLWV